MPYSTEVIDGGKGILHIGRDIVRGEELLASANGVLELVKGGTSPSYALTDLSDVSEFRVSAKEIKLNAQLNIMISKYIRKAKVAIVAPNDHIYGMARMWQAHTDKSGWVTEIFRNKDNAIEWLKGNN